MSNKWKPVTDPILVQPLEVPIRAFGEELQELAFRAPLAGDIYRAGTPIDYDPRYDPPRMIVNEAKGFAMMSTLSGVPVASLERMTSNDWTKCFWGLARFFLPTLSSKPPEPPEDSPGSTTVIQESS